MNKKNCCRNCKQKSKESKKQKSGGRELPSNVLIFDNVGTGDDGLSSPHDQRVVLRLAKAG